MNLNLLSNVLFFGLIQSISCAYVEVCTDGPGVLDIPITFSAKLKGDAPIDVNQFWYVFEDKGIYPPHRLEILSGREVNFTTTYKFNEVSVGTYHMKVQVFAYVWGWKGWLIADHQISFKLQNGLFIDIQLKQSGVSDLALNHSKVAANRVLEMNAKMNGPDFVRNASNSYTWSFDGRTFGPYSSPDLNHTFVVNKIYVLEVRVLSNITLPNRNITKLGNMMRTISVINQIKDINITGNTWLLDGALLQLKVNCSGGDPPFGYCYDFFRTKQTNYSCEPQKLRKKCYFPITHYFPENDTYFIEIMVFNDINFKHKTISVKVYDIVRKTQLFFVILPIMSSILAIIIVVVGIAYHLQQRQRMNLTLEVADFDFQNDENLVVKTFFERLRESLATALRETVTYPCNPCTRPNNYDDLIDDTYTGETIRSNGTEISRNAVIK